MSDPSNQTPAIPMSTTIDRREAVKRISAMLGGAISAPTLAGILSGCQAGVAPGLRIFTTPQLNLLDLLTEHIIPETDTPGARAARVPEFIDAMLADFYTEEHRTRFLTGLAEVDEKANAAHGSSFSDLSNEEQIALLTSMDEEAYPDLDNMSDEERAAYDRLQNEEGRPFFATLKELTVSGYYTSEVGATQELKVNPMVVYRGDIPYDEVGHAWA